MVVIDTSAWVEYLREGHPEICRKVEQALGEEVVALGDLIYCEVMQGLYDARQRVEVSRLLSALPKVEMVGFEMAEKSADNYRMLRGKGLTVRKTIDVLIGTSCAELGHRLLHHDRDFDLIAPHIGLRLY
jgi:predicted nucleic acid-binding protein